MKKAATQLLEAISAQANPKKAAWLENYVKHGIQSYGVGIPKLRQLVKAWEQKQHLLQASEVDQVAVLNTWMAHSHSEPQLAAILWVQVVGKDLPTALLLAWVEEWLNRGWVIDWNVCDWLCVRILGPLLVRSPEVVAPVLQGWNEAENVWKARCSLVPFAVSGRLELHRDWLLEGSAVLIQREERFCKTAVGWALREHSKKHLPDVLTFLDRYSAYTTKEVIRNATKYQKKGSS